MRRFFPLVPAWWAHIKNQRILNDYITGIIYRRWDLIQAEKVQPAGPRENGDAVATAAGSGVANGNGGGVGHNGNDSPSRRRDILDKVLHSLEPGEWGPAAALQVRLVNTFWRLECDAWWVYRSVGACEVLAL